MHSLEVLWKGELPLFSITWQFDTTKSIAFTSDIEEKIDDFWARVINIHPKLYNGTLVCLHDIDFHSNTLNLLVGFIQFKSVFYHYENKKPLAVTFGSLGFQVLIYNPSRTHILIGKRTATSEFKPGHLTVPGGIFEKIDLDGSIIQACLREINEETSLLVNEDSFKLLTIYREEFQISTGLLVEVETQKENYTNYNSTLEIPGNEEFENNKLTWYPISRLNELKDKPMLAGLAFLINENSSE